MSKFSSTKWNWSDEERELAVNQFCKLLQFPTVSSTGCSDGSYNLCGDWLLHQLQSLQLDKSFILEESVANKPIVVGVWRGSESSLPGILLNSHYDVVPVIEEKWSVPAFEGLRKEGKIYGRGTQDMKCVCMEYIVALQQLKKNGFEPKRDIFITFVPDEEIGGADGMNVLIASKWFQTLTIDLALDEGLASTDNNFSVFYGERLPWWVKVEAVGNTGHASRFIDGTAVEQVVGVVNRALEFRKAQKDILHGVGQHAGCSHAVAKKKEATLGDVTTLNVTMLRAGIRAGNDDVINVVPPFAEAGFDIRISPHVDPKEIADQLTCWCEEVQGQTAGLGIDQGLSWKFINNPMYCHATTSTSTESNRWWGVFCTAVQEFDNVDLVPQIFPAATDSRFLRAIGMKAFGFSPIRNSPILLHEHDEYLDESVFLEGCEVYMKLISALSSVGL